MSGESDIERARRLRDEKRRPDEIEDGEFAYQEWDYDYMAVGIIDGDRPIAFLHDMECLVGTCMTAEDARRLAADLLGAAEIYERGNGGGKSA